ncbi:MAG TPA: diaminopimelate decarboxylase [Solirubrobacterales bacterium]|nr:diaminopimelate decarboxylase [Solirubrobacterales bacterium]
MTEPTIADPVASSPVYPAGSRVNERGHLEIGGCDLIDVVAEFGSPAYVYAEDDIRERAATYMEAFRARTDDFEVLYASKAAPITAIYRLCAELGLSVDVASGGELHMALRAGFGPQRIYMHGNNKTEAELRYAAESEVGHLILDSFDEIERADRLARRAQDVLIRVTPGIRPSTHDYVATGGLDSKFGFGLEDGLARRAIDAVRATENLRLVGLHAHIGSQIFELEPYVKAIEALAELWDGELRILNVGGGLGIAYTSDDDPPAIEEYVDVKVRGVQRVFDPAPRILIEPGRSLVGNAGLTVYTVGTVKEIPGVRTYIAVDGGMSDNMRPMLYGARYEALIANRASEPADSPVTVAGMHCESGDILIQDAMLASPSPGDLLVTPATGAYGYAMASNYNGLPRPPVVFCSGGDARAVVRRETYDDLLARDAE